MQPTLAVKKKERELQFKPDISTTPHFTANLLRSQGVYGYCTILQSANKNSGPFFTLGKPLIKPLAERECLYHQSYKCKQVQRGTFLNVTVICCFDNGYACCTCIFGGVKCHLPVNWKHNSCVSCGTLGSGGAGLKQRCN